jgi:UDP-N-acetyl-D-mannosaminuronic acid transferase (WecB/TagA/CpsF family)
MSKPSTEQILGVRFFNGSAREAIEQISRTGGLVVAPAAASMVNLRYDEGYRSALAAADVAIADSGWMVLLWRLFTGRRVTRSSGLEYVKRLLEHDSIRQTGAAIWVVPSEIAREKTINFLHRASIAVAAEDVYVAPKYGRVVNDETLLDLVRQRRPAHIVIAVGGGTQDKLGLFLKRNLDYTPAIHCIGAALGFLTGDQIKIPGWADRFYLGWFLRLLAQPRIFIPRLWSAHELPWLISRYGKEMPPMRAQLQVRSR